MKVNNPRILGIGNALVDIMTRMDHDDYLQQFGLPKGSMTLVDAGRSRSVYDGTVHLERTIRSGGSAANTIHGTARLGIDSAFLGKIGRDELGRIFHDDLVQSRIRPSLLYSDTESGRAIALVSPDTERTFATYLGAADELTETDILPELFNGYEYFHIEGYLVQNHALLDKALKTAREMKMKVSLDLASYNVVAENREFLHRVIREYVDIVFANEDEARALTGLEPGEALDVLARYSDIAVVKVGRNGSLVKQGENVHQVGIIRVDSVDTTGAGDLYASGFLYGRMMGLPVEKCGRIGAILGGKVIEVIGPKLDDRGWENALEMIRAV